MEDIQDIVNNIVRGCKQAGLEVPEILAAFVARTVVENNGSTFALDGRVTPDLVEEVILQSVSKLLERDSPSLEMIKMQVDFDRTYLKEETDAQKKLSNRSKLIATHREGIMEIHMEDANDFESLTTLYRKIFKFLLEFAPNSRGSDRAVEREVAAALESVFPRVGLKAFILLDLDEKIAQLMELGRIILGIRLFNREEGRGGAGIDNMDKDSGILANVLFQDIDREVDYFMDACVKYEKAIINAHIYRRKKKNEQRLAAQAKANDDEKTAEVIAKEIEIKQQQRETAQSLKERTKANKMDVSDYVIDRWGKELANRRQYLGFLKSLQVEVVEMHEKVTQLGDKIRIELANVKALVSNKTSVPKELVYPRFDSLGGLWIELYEEVVTMIARSNTFQALCKYRLSFNPTLVDSYVDYSDEYEAEMKQEALEDQAEGKWEEKAEHKAEEKGISPKPSITEVKQEESKISSIEFVDPEEREQSKLFDDSIAFDEVNNQGATLLSVQNTPDFILLPLELQGYCPWTIVEARGLLIPGKPSLGIIRYDNLYYVCDHVLAIKAFMSDPEKYLTKIRNRALDNPEYIHLLRLQRWFPTASIARLLKLQEVSLENNNGPRKKDVGTGTPTHFIESYIDVNYHWNEWELRRRALKIVNLKNCSTTSQQTDKSHFRRDNNTQLNEVRATGTQTRRDKGTNPPVVTTYLEGLRGMKIDESSAIAPIEPKGYVGARSMSVSYDEMEVKPDSYIKLKQEASSRKLIHPKVNVVRLELDL